LVRSGDRRGGLGVWGGRERPGMARTSVTLTQGGRDALDNYTAVLQRLLDSGRPS